MSSVNSALRATLKHKISCTGCGLHTGKTVNMTLLPAAAETGIVFKRTDIVKETPFIAARYDNAVDTRLGTTLGNKDNVRVATVEHLLSALSGCGVTDVIIELDGPEVPVMDGSAAPFVFLIDCAGVKNFNMSRRTLTILKKVRVEEGDKFAELSPGKDFKINFEIDFANTTIGKQTRSISLNKTLFKTEISRARTFGFVEEAEALRKAGLALGGSPDNAIILDKNGVLNKGGLRYADEFVRHKILDAIGDLFLAGADIQGVYTGYKSGHTLNNKLLRAVFNDASAYRFEVTERVPASKVELNTIAA